METLGRYEIKSEIGRGGCGVVYRAVDPSIGRTVAIKTIRTDGSDERERFRREARSAGMLSHPNIVTIHEFSESPDGMFIAMEYVDGQTLGQRMKGQRLPIPFVLATLRAAGDALDYAHAHNIVHRDVKPANFLITKSGRLKITDFGIAKMLDNVGMTNTGVVIGTAHYMSPEQITASEVTGASDQFSLGVVAYEMLAGRRPFEGNSWPTIIHNLMASTPPHITEFRPEFGGPVSEVLHKVLSKDPKDRYASCTAFVDALEGAILGISGQRIAAGAEVGANPALRSVTPSSLADTETILMPTLPDAPTVTAPALAIHEIERPPGSGSSTKQSKKTTWIMPAVAGVVIVIGLGVWLGLQSYRPPQPMAVPPTAASDPKQEASAPDLALPAAPSPEPSPEPAPELATPPAVQIPESRVASSKSGSSNQPGGQTKASAPLLRAAAPRSNADSPAAPVPQSAPPPVATTPTPPPATASTVLPIPPPPPVQQAARAEPPPALAPITPPLTPPPPPAAAKGPDPAEVAAQQRAAELQASRRMIADAVSRYRQAFETRNMDALKAVWPGLGRNDQNSFQNFFRIARSIRLELTPLSDPEITPIGATARYRRSLAASDNRGALPAEDQTVKITFRKSGSQMLIESIEATDR